MSLKQRLQDDTKAAMLAKDRFRTDVLNSLKASILNEEVAQGKRDEGLADVEIEQIVSREIKKRNESSKLYQDAGRQELADNEIAERDILVEYLPKQLTESEVEAVVRQTIEDLNKSGPVNMGVVIGAVKKQLGNSADGAVIARIVKDSI